MQAFSGMHALARRALAARYVIVFFDALPIKIRLGNDLNAEDIWFALGIGLDGRKDILGMWLPGSDRAGFWRAVVSDLIYRGVGDALISVTPADSQCQSAVTGGFSATTVLPGLSWATPALRDQVPGRDRPTIFNRLRAVLLCPSEGEARRDLQGMADGLEGDLFQEIARSWQENWPAFTPYFAFSPREREVLCLDAAKSLSDKLRRRDVKLPTVFGDTEAALVTTSHLVRLAANEWGVAPEKWLAARPCFSARYGARFPLD